MVELNGLLSNPRFDEEVRKLTEIVEQARASGKRKRSPPKTKPPQGQILRTIKLVLMEHPDGLHTYEVRRLVEERLGRKLPKSTVKDALATNQAFSGLGMGFIGSAQHNLALLLAKC